MECPAIIEPAQAARVAILRAGRAPRVTAPRITNGPTLLTGLVRCGVCGGNLTIATGKGGRYAYYKCQRKVNGGSSICTSSGIPKKHLDDAVVAVTEQRVLDPDRMRELRRSVLEVSDQAEVRRRRDLGTARDARTRAETKLDRLTDLILEGLLASKDRRRHASSPTCAAPPTR